MLVFIWRGVLFLINLYLNANAEEIVGDLFTRTNDFGGHQVSFGNIRFDYDYRGTFLRLTDVKIFPGEEITDKDKIKFNLTFDQASLTGFSWKGLLFENSIRLDRKSTRLNSSHVKISYAVFCLKKKKQ